jgi:uncharacterized cupin superfamily protein
MKDLFVHPGLADIDLGPFHPKPTRLTEGQTEASTQLWQSEDGLVQVGVWECTPGRFTADRRTNSEICHIIRGRVEMRHVDGTTRLLGPGDCLVLPMGWVGEWNILETTRKLYVIHRSAAG